MSSTPRPGFQKRPRLGPWAQSLSLNFLYWNRGENVKNTKAGQYQSAPPHGTLEGINGTTPCKPLTASNAPQGKGDYWSDPKATCSHASSQASARGQRQTRLATPAGVEGRRRERRPKREGVEAAGARHAARQREEGARSRRSGASTQAQGRARGWRLLSAAGDTARWGTRRWCGGGGGARAPLAGWGGGGGGDCRTWPGPGPGCNPGGAGFVAGGRAWGAGPRRSVGEGGAGPGLTPRAPPRDEPGASSSLHCPSLGVPVSAVARVATQTVVTVSCSYRRFPLSFQVRLPK